MNDLVRNAFDPRAVARVKLGQPREESPLARRASTPVRMVFWGQWVVATLIQVSLLVLLCLDKSGEVASQYRILALFSAVISIPLYAVYRVYSTRQGYLVGLARLGAAWATLIALLVFTAFVTKTSAEYSREVVLQWVIAAMAAQALAFMPLHRLAQKLYSTIGTSITSVVIGSGRIAHDLARKLRYDRKEAMLGLVVPDEDTEPGPEDPIYFPTLGSITQLRAIIRENDINRVYIALPARETDQIEGLYVDLLDANVDVVWVPDFANLKLLNHSVHDLGGIPAIYLNESPLTAHPGAALLKALMDRTCALLGILLLSPVLVACAVAVKLSSPGPVLFRQERHGWNGSVIEVLKFRSMRVHQDPVVKQATRNDPRVTPVGRFLRRTSLDELPQLFNVLRGDMSLVGPRPHAVAHNDYYSGKIQAYMARHRIKPGITGLAQISGYRGETDTLEKMQRRVELDLEYINNWSLWLDIKILIKTPLTLFSKDIY